MCYVRGSLVAQRQRTCLQRRSCRRHGFDPWVPWRRAWQPAPVFLPGGPHGVRSLEGCNPRITNSQTQLKQLSTAQYVMRLLPQFKKNKRKKYAFVVNLQCARNEQADEACGAPSPVAEPVMVKQQIHMLRMGNCKPTGEGPSFCFLSCVGLSLWKVRW